MRFMAPAVLVADDMLADNHAEWPSRIKTVVSFEPGVQKRHCLG